MQLNVLLHVPRLGLHASDHFMPSQRPRQVRARRDFSKRNCAYSDLGTSLCHVFKLDVARKLPTLKRTVSEWVAAFSLLSRCATCCFALLCPLFAKARLMKQTHASPDRLSLTSIKPNKAWAQAVRSWNIHSLDTQTSIRDASPMHCLI